MANEKKFEEAIAKMDFFLKEKNMFDAAVDELAERESAGKKSEKVASVVANQKSGSTK